MKRFTISVDMFFALSCEQNIASFDAYGAHDLFVSSLASGIGSGLGRVDLGTARER